MIPAYRSMDSYPFQRNPISFPHYCHPSIEAIPPQMKVDPSKPPFSYDPRWPYAGNFGHPIPPHFCCGHNNFPCYNSYMPSYPHAPSPMYYSGACPAYSEPYFVPYSPQPHHTMELPRYEYDKFMPREHHCCGCLNHPCHQKEGRGVKIEEEHEPDGGKKVNDALVPIQLKNYPYPFFVPQEYASNKQLRNPNTMEVSEQDKMSRDRKPAGVENSNADAQADQEPRVWNGWLPFDIKDSPNIFHDGYGIKNQKHESENNRRESEDGKTDKRHQSEQKRSEFPFPIFWLPYYNKQEEESGKTNNQENTSSPKIIEEAPHSFKSVPVKFQVDGGANGTGSNQAQYTNTGEDVPHSFKSVPVKFQVNGGANGTGSNQAQYTNTGDEVPHSFKSVPVKFQVNGGANGTRSNQAQYTNTGEEVPHSFKSVPVKFQVNGGANGTGSNQAQYTNTGVSDAAEKVTNARSIPVKQIHLHQGKENSEGSQQREMNASLKQMEENVAKKDSCTGDKKRQSTSSPKGSKLPPVCLRVDPLPKNKNGNRSSRSPSPPSSKEHSKEEQSKATSGETLKTPVCGSNDKAPPNSSHQNAPDISEKVKPKEKIIPVSECKTSENKGVDSMDGCQSQKNVDIPSEGLKGTMETCTDGDEYRTEDKKAEKGEEKVMEETTGLKEVRDSSAQTDSDKKAGRVLSDADAAVLIQSTYRGYQVRKWEPLKKLKQIDEVRKEVTDVRGRVEAFERSADLQHDDKQKVAVGETIMRLLLKLDTLQGLHPTIREIRKSLARELTILQERLDSITAKKPQQQMEDFDVQKHVEVTPMNMQNEEHVQKEQEEEVAVLEDSSEGISGDVKDPCANDGGSESQSPVDSASNEGAEPVELPNGSDNEDTSQVIAADALDSTRDVSENAETTVELEAKSDVNDIPIEATVREDLSKGVINEEKEEHHDTSSESLPTMVDVSARDEVDSKNHAVMEPPVGVLGEDERVNEMNISKQEAQTENEIIIEELPLGLLDENEDTAISEFKRHDQAMPKTHKDVQLAQEGEYKADEKTSSSTDDTAREAQLEQQLEEQEEVQSSGESDGWVKIEFQGGGELKKDAPMDMEVEFHSGEEVGNDTKLPPLTTQGNGHDSHEPRNDSVCIESNGVNNILPEQMEFVPMNNIQKEEKTEEEIAERDTLVMVAEETLNADDKGTETLAQEETELSAALPASQEPEVPVAEHDGGLNGDAKLLEENEKLREMMKKLLEAGNEQLSVISELTGKVKDLEKKLAKGRSKRVKKKRYRPATSKMSCMKSS